MAVELSYLIVNTHQRELLLRGLDAVARERESLPFATHVLVLDNASQDGSAEAARAHPAVDEVIALDERRGKGVNDSALLERAQGRYGLLLNEDSELLPGATAALRDALEGDPAAGAAAARLLRPDGVVQPSAWRFPTPWTAAASALALHRRLVVQSDGVGARRPLDRAQDSGGDAPPRPVDWAQSAAMLVRLGAARQIGFFDPAFFVYSDEVDFCRRLRDAGWHTLHVPGASAIHHEQLSTGAVPERRIVELSRNRDAYMRKHHSPGAARAVRWLSALTYATRAGAALVLPGHDPRRYRRHVTASLWPGRGEGLRETAQEFNRGRRGDGGGASSSD